MVVREQRFSFNHVREVLGGVLDHDLHAKRVDSLCDATLGVLRSASLAVCTIGQGLAAARGLNPKHATKQVDRLLSNPMINVDDILVRWVPYVVGARNAIVVASDYCVTPRWSGHRRQRPAAVDTLASPKAHQCACRLKRQPPVRQFNQHTQPRQLPLAHPNHRHRMSPRTSRRQLVPMTSLSGTRVTFLSVIYTTLPHKAPFC